MIQNLAIAVCVSVLAVIACNFSFAPTGKGCKSTFTTVASALHQANQK